MLMLMLTAAALSSLLLGAQPVAAPDQAALAKCLAAFTAAQQQAGAPVGDFTNALATACYSQERAWRDAYLAAAAVRGVRQVPADSEAHLAILNLRNSYRDAFLAAQTICAPEARRR